MMAGRDRAALQQLQTRHAKSLYALAYQILMDAEAAERVVGEVFEYAWKRAGLWAALASGSRRRTVGEWLSSLTRVGALARVRTRSRFRQAAVLMD